MVTQNFLAIDLGASSGRGIVGYFDGKKISIEEIYRFEHFLSTLNGKRYWDILELNRQVKNILKKSVGSCIPLNGIGIDTWGLDYGLLDKNGDLLGQVYSYRNSTEKTVKKVWEIMDCQELFSITGVGHLVYNTVYQLYDRILTHDVALQNAETMLLLPDLIAYFLTGEKATEYTDAMTTMLLDTKEKNWSDEILNQMGFPRHIFTSIQFPGTKRGDVLRSIREETGLGNTHLYTVASHDTASAIAAIPAKHEKFVYISSGTWSLIGAENDQPIISEKVFRTGYSNEGSLQGHYRLNKNIMGLGLIQQCRREWALSGKNLSWTEIVDSAQEAKPFQLFLNPDAMEFFDMQNIIYKIMEYGKRKNVEIDSVGAVARCIYESLAMKYRYSIEELQSITGEEYQSVYIVGGGCQNNLLNQFVADATGKQVIAGPVEGASMANMLTQAMAVGEVASVEEIREIIGNSVATKTYWPKNQKVWEEKYQDFLDIL